MSALRDFAVGCVGHFLIALAAAALLGSATHYLGFSSRVVFAVVIVVIFVTSVLIPDKKQTKP